MGWNWIEVPLFLDEEFTRLCISFSVMERKEDSLRTESCSDEHWSKVGAFYIGIYLFAYVFYLGDEEFIQICIVNVYCCG